MIYLLTAIFFLASIFFAMIGIGGGVFYTPLQIYLLNIPIQSAVANSLFVIIFASLSATSVYRKNQKVDYALGIILEVSTAMGSFAGGYISAFISQKAIIVLLGAVLLAVSYIMIKGWKKDAGIKWHVHTLVIRRKFKGKDYEIPMLVAVPVTFLAGTVAGLAGIAGGTIKVPLMVLLLGIPMDIAVGTSSFMIGITSLSGLIGHLIHGHLMLKLAIPFAIAVVLGGNIGARVAVNLPAGKLKKIFGWALLLIALSMFWKAMRM